jgi:hypothetical protein
VFLLVMLVFVRLFGPWMRAFLAGAPIPVITLLGMTFRRTPVNKIVDWKIIAAQARLPITTAQIESAYLQGADVELAVLAMNRAHETGVDLTGTTPSARMLRTGCGKSCCSPGAPPPLRPRIDSNELSFGEMLFAGHRTAGQAAKGHRDLQQRDQTRMQAAGFRMRRENGRFGPAVPALPTLRRSAPQAGPNSGPRRIDLAHTGPVHTGPVHTGPVHTGPVHMVARCFADHRQRERRTQQSGAQPQKQAAPNIA